MSSVVQQAPPETFFTRMRQRADEGFLYVGGLTELAGQTLVQLRRGPMERPLLTAQLDQIGVRSLSIVVITSAFIGMVLALQTAYALADFGGKMFVGTIVSLSLVRELAPVLMSLMVGGRVGAGMAAELGTMKVTEQIEALRSMGVHPIDYLVVPRTLAMVIAMPLLVAECVGLGILAGYFVGTRVLGINEPYYV
ncbi:MAG TPA: ABC transporter permease, partial [Thermoanaerobaculia bacterium]